MARAGSRNWRNNKERGPHHAASARAVLPATMAVLEVFFGSERAEAVKPSSLTGERMRFSWTEDWKGTGTPFLNEVTVGGCAADASGQEEPIEPAMPEADGPSSSFEGYFTHVGAYVDPQDDFEMTVGRIAEGNMLSMRFLRSYAAPRAASKSGGAAPGRVDFTQWVAHGFLSDEQVAELAGAILDARARGCTPEQTMRAADEALGQLPSPVPMR